jgi:hypothetical protein
MKKTRSKKSRGIGPLSTGIHLRLADSFDLDQRYAVLLQYDFFEKCSGIPISGEMAKFNTSIKNSAPTRLKTLLHVSKI